MFIIDILINFRTTYVSDQARLKNQSNKNISHFPLAAAAAAAAAARSKMILYSYNRMNSSEVGEFIKERFKEQKRKHTFDK